MTFVFFLIGLIAGACIGIITTCLLIIAKYSDERKYHE
nr:MAG TPA: Protein of unknown function (DUF3789) [Caudoviricetes sp.]